MAQAWFAIPGSLETPTGGYAYARRLIAALGRRGWQLDVLTLPKTFPLPPPDDHDRACLALSALAADRPVIIDGLAFGALDATFLAGARHRWVALIHHPLALETGHDGATAHRLCESEKAALAAASAVIVTSPSTARCLVADYGVAEERVTMALPGTARVARSSGSRPAPHLLSVATLTPRKGHDVLVGALARIAALEWTAVWVGSPSRCPATAEAVRHAVVEAGLVERIEIAGEVTADELECIYRRSDIFVLPSRHEGYGMAFAEALAHGLPVVGCAVGALPETVPQDAGVLVPPDDVPALAGALETLLVDGSRRRVMAQAAWRHASSLPTWDDAAARVEAVLAAVMTA